MIKASDLIAKYLEDAGINLIFGVQGGAVVHLFDSIHEKTNMRVVYTHHEQSAALAAVANAKQHKSIGVCIVTSGPAASNAITGLLSAWQDSTPVIFISGQTRKEQVSYGKAVRQIGSQECNILDVVKPWCKRIWFVESASEISKIMIEARMTTVQDRPGPVWIDIPVDIQWEECEDKIKEDGNTTKPDCIAREDIQELVLQLEKSKRPLFVMGRLNYEEKQLNKIFNKFNELGVTIATTWGSANISKGICQNSGIIGVNGQPAANYAVRAADTLVFIGCHFSITQSGNSFEEILEKQNLYYINIDGEELANTNWNRENTKKIKIDANVFLKELEKEINNSKMQKKQWGAWEMILKKVIEDLSPTNAIKILGESKYISSHRFLDNLYKELNEGDLVVVDGGGCALYAGYQCLPAKGKFSIICSTAISAMGTGLPELLGAGKYNKGLNVCIIGDGSIMFNLQELQSIKTHLESACIIVINNNGYQAIRMTQKDFLNSRYYGTSPGDNGINIPEVRKLASTFGYEYIKVCSQRKMKEAINKLTKRRPKHYMIELKVNPSQGNLFSASYIEQEDTSFKQQEIYKMNPFSNYKFPQIN